MMTEAEASSASRLAATRDATSSADASFAAEALAVAAPPTGCWDAMPSAATPAVPPVPPPPGRPEQQATSFGGVGFVTRNMAAAAAAAATAATAAMTPLLALGEHAWTKARTRQPFISQHRRVSGAGSSESLRGTAYLPSGHYPSPSIHPSVMDPEAAADRVVSQVSQSAGRPRPSGAVVGADVGGGNERALEVLSLLRDLTGG